MRMNNMEIMMCENEAKYETICFEPDIFTPVTYRVYYCIRVQCECPEKKCRIKTDLQRMKRDD
jgi:hypothetical protein